METDVALVISGIVSAFVQVIKAMGIEHQKGVWLAALCSLVGVLIYAFSFEPSFERVLIWKYFAAFGMVLLAAMGTFGLIRQSANMVTDIKGAGAAFRQSLTGGTGDGKG